MLWMEMQFFIKFWTCCYNFYPWGLSSTSIHKLQIKWIFRQSIYGRYTYSKTQNLINLYFCNMKLNAFRWIFENAHLFEGKCSDWMILIRSWIKSVEQLLVKENSVSWMHELDSIANVNLSDNQKKFSE